MINRRHIRLKVLQSLYAFFTSKNQDLIQAESNMISHISTIQDLYLLLLSLPVLLSRFSLVFFSEQKAKHFPTELDKNPKFKFKNNQLIKIISEDKKISKYLESLSSVWVNNEHDFFRKLFIKIWKSNEYNQYINSDASSFYEDKGFLLSMFKNYIFEDELLHHILEEESIYWIDDLPFIANIIYNQLRVLELNKATCFVSTIFKNKEDENFAIRLFKKTISKNKEFDDIIVNKAKNWDLDRIAIMDKILLKMGLCELLYFQEIPVKVTLNEYIEIAKYYSTTKSKSFINGILDNVISEFQKSNKIIKVGRGLVE